MNPGAILVGLAVAIVTIAYIARPFRKTPVVDQEIEAWLAAIKSRPEAPVSEALSVLPPDGVEAVTVAMPGADVPQRVEQQSDVTFCYQCGRPVKPHHRFCPRCGTGLHEDEAS